MLAAVGHGGLRDAQIINRMQEELRREAHKVVTDEQVLENAAEGKEKPADGRHEKKKKSGIIVKGLSDVAVHFSKCCSPVPGDEIVGFVTRGRGVSIHRTDCINMINLPEDERSRIIEAEWQVTENDSSSEQYSTEIQIFVQ